MAWTMLFMAGFFEVAWTLALTYLSSFASGFLMALTLDTPLAWLTYSAALLATALLPGLYLMHKARDAA